MLLEKAMKRLEEAEALDQPAEAAGQVVGRPPGPGWSRTRSAGPGWATGSTR